MYILDLAQIKLINCRLRTPVKGSFRAMMAFSKDRDELLTFGFINACFRLSQFKKMTKLPHYLMHLIGKWISTEYVHLILYHNDWRYRNDESHAHWKIHLDDILTSAVCR